MKILRLHSEKETHDIAVTYKEKPAWHGPDGLAFSFCF